MNFLICPIALISYLVYSISIYKIMLGCFRRKRFANFGLSQYTFMYLLANKVPNKETNKVTKVKSLDSQTHE